jgi:hypothetical protein
MEKFIWNFSFTETLPGKADRSCRINGSRFIELKFEVNEGVLIEYTQN